MAATAKNKYAAGLNSELFKALGHPTRYGILMIAGEREVSPTELSELLELPFQHVYRQVRVLESDGLLELVDTDTRMGGEQHYFRAVVRPIIDTAAWDQLPLLAREATTAVNCGVIIGEISASVDARRFDAHPNRSIVRRPVRVDGDGATAIEQAAIAFDKVCVQAELDSVQRDSHDRVEMTAATFLFQRASD